jgi:hypothetical protein
VGVRLGGAGLVEPEAAQAATFPLVFPLVFASSIFVPVATMPGWLQGFAEHQPVSVTATAVRALATGADPGGAVWQSAAWSVGLLAVLLPLAARAYRRAGPEVTLDGTTPRPHPSPGPAAPWSSSPRDRWDRLAPPRPLPPRPLSWSAATRTRRSGSRPSAETACSRGCPWLAGGVRRLSQSCWPSTAARRADRNAGGCTRPPHHGRRHEASLAVNLLGTYLLARGPPRPARETRLCARQQQRVRLARPAFDDPQSRHWYRGLDIYGRTKLYGAAALLDLSRERPELHLVLADPGGARTGMTDGMTPSSVPLPMRALWPLFRLAQGQMTVQRAARSSVIAATDADVLDGTWLRPDGRPTALPSQLRSRDVQQRARSLAETLLGS